MKHQDAQFTTRQDDLAKEISKIEKERADISNLKKMVSFKANPLQYSEKEKELQVRYSDQNSKIMSLVSLQFDS
jgi:hypothetical protein